jgi:hypothetical protein
MGLIGIPLKAVVPFFAQAANHPLPGDLKSADGTTLGIGTHGIGGGVSPYILPDLRNKFLLGADRTKDPKDAGQYISFISNMTASGNSFDYQIIQGNPNYTIVSGDLFQYDVYWPSGSIPGSGGGCGAVDLSATNGDTFRSHSVNDQNGISNHPNADLRTYALDKWYTRVFSLSSMLGLILNGFILSHEYDGTFSSLTSRFQNICITDASGNIKFKAWWSGDGTPTYAVHAISSATFVSGNATTLGAPGPNGTAGEHSKVIKTPHIPVHNHSGSTDSQGAHTHGTSISAHIAHSHNPSDGRKFVLTSGGTQASNSSGTAYTAITCQMAVTTANGSHGHTVSPGADGGYAHGLTITTASSGGTNAGQTAFDPRPRHHGTVFTLKSGAATRLQSLGLGTIMMWYADTQNETLPTGMSYCDGSTLTSGNHQVPNQSGSILYSLVLPDLRNRFLIGADRTKGLGVAGTTTEGSSGAPGPGYTSGLHSISIGILNFVDHGHTGATDAAGTHNHTWTISANGDHNHGSAVGGYNLTSGTGATYSESIGSFDSEVEVDGITTITSTNDSGNHSFFIGGGGAHNHTVTINSNGSGTAWDNRPSFIGLVHLMKTQAGSLLSVPLKTVVALRADAANETLPPQWAYCDGSTLTPGNFDMTANSGGNYVLPDFRNFFPLGADRTKTVANTGGTTNAASDAPGPKGTAGSHTHTMTTSEMPAHIHAVTSGAIGDHIHGGSVGTSSDGGHAHITGCHTFFTTTDGGFHNFGSSHNSSTSAVSTYSSVLGAATQPGHGTSCDTQGAHTHVVTVDNAGTGSAFAQRPRFHGLVFIMKVKR